MVDRLRSALSALGAVLTGAGVLILLFVAYQLWGTGLYTSRQQDSLRSQFKQKAKVAESAPATTSTTIDPLHLPPPPPSGESVANIRIPKIGVDKYVVQGVGLGDLRKGPGHYPDTPMPGEQGNAAIAGHRTTYGAPFNRLDELAPGDEILVTTVKGTFTYKVSSTKVVKPSQVEVSLYRTTSTELSCKSSRSKPRPLKIRLSSRNVTIRSPRLRLKLLFDSCASVFDVTPLVMGRGSYRSPKPGATPAPGPSLNNR